jgi:hypothetical protein
VLRIRRATLGLLVAATSTVLLPRVARAAGEMDPTTERLVDQPANLPPGQTCQSVAADPGALLAAGLSPIDYVCRPNHRAFANMVAELGYAIAPTSFYPARTTGVGGFQISLEASYTGISANRSVPAANGGSIRYWHLGTRGAPNAAENVTPDSLLQVYAIKARKGLPLGFELAGSFGYVANTSLWVGGGDVRWSLLEGFRAGPLGYVPDVSFGAGVRTLTGTSRFYLTTVGVDVRASKAFTLADSAQLIPSIGLQRLIIFGDSTVIDATPNVDALAQCGYDGLGPASGAPICRNKMSNGADANVDFSNNFTFESVRLHRSRGLVALNYRYDIAWLGSQVAFDLTDPRDENPVLVGKRQWTVSVEGGVHF